MEGWVKRNATAIGVLLGLLFLAGWAARGDDAALGAAVLMFVIALLGDRLKEAPGGFKFYPERFARLVRVQPPIESATAPLPRSAWTAEATLGLSGSLSAARRGVFTVDAEIASDALQSLANAVEEHPPETLEQLADLTAEAVRRSTADALHAGPAVAADELRRQAESYRGNSDTLAVEPEYVGTLQSLADDLDRVFPTHPDRFAENVATTTVMSAGRLIRGETAQRAGAISVATKQPLLAGTTSIRIAIDTPGVTFAAEPLLSFNTRSGATATCRREAENMMAVDLVGPSTIPVIFSLSGIALSVARDAPLGAVRVTASLGDSTEHAIASIGSVASAG